MDQEKIGSFIAENRKAKGFTQIEFAEKLGVSNKSVSRWETGKNMPDVSLFLPICDALDISVKLFLSFWGDVLFAFIIILALCPLHLWRLVLYSH